MNSWLTSALAEQLGWILLHSIWQGCLIALCLWAALYLLKRARASIRYVLSLTALMLMLAAPVATWLMMDGVQQYQHEGVNPNEIATAHWELEDNAATPVVIGEVPARVDAGNTVAESEKSTWLSEAEFRAVLPWMGTAWMTGVILYLVHLMGGWYMSRRLLYRGTIDPPEKLKHQWRRMATQMGIGRTVEFQLSDRATTPLTLGWWKPVVLLPVSITTGLPPDQLRAIIAHELAHIRRHDYAVNILQSVVEVLFFYHPAAWWIARQVRQEREYCCDDVAKELGGPLVYGRALAALEEIPQNRQSKLAIAATEGRLLQRIRRLLQPEATDIVAGNKLAPAAFVILAALALAGTTAVSGITESVPEDGGTLSHDISAIAGGLPSEIPGHLRDVLEWQPSETEPDTTETTEPDAVLPERQVLLPIDTLETPLEPEAPPPFLRDLGDGLRSLDSLKMYFPRADSLAVHILSGMSDPAGIAINVNPDVRIEGLPFDTTELRFPPFKGHEQLEEEMRELREKFEQQAEEMREKREQWLELHQDEHREKMEAVREQWEEHRERAQEEAEHARAEARQARERALQEVPAQLQGALEDLRDKQAELNSRITELQARQQENDLSQSEERELQELTRRHDSLDHAIRALQEAIDRVTSRSTDRALEEIN